MSRFSNASATYEPIPGSFQVLLPTVTASLATTKNQPPETDIMVFHTRPGMANGTSMRQNFCHAERRNAVAHSARSAGTVFND